MRFNLAFFGPEAVFHLRRDFFVAVQHGLEELGHDVSLSGLQLDSARFNLIMGAYFLPPDSLRGIEKAGVRFAHVNTEVIANDLLNFNPQKTDFLGAYLPSMRAGAFVWDVLPDNMAEHRRYGTNAHLFRWGWHPRMEEIAHRPKEYDFYFYGLLSPRRERIMRELMRHGITAVVDGSCPYFVRNDRIARARMVLNIIQDEKYRHVGSFRVCYLLNNRVAVLGEPENDPLGYLRGTRVVPEEGLLEAVRELREGDAWRAVGEAGYQAFRETPMRAGLEALLEASFGAVAGARAAS